MEILNVLLKVNEQLDEDTTEVYLQGPEAITVMEATVLMELHGEHCLSMVKVVGTVDTDRSAEKERLNLKYDSDIVDKVMPGRSPMATKLADLELPKEALDKRKPKDHKLHEDGSLFGQAPTVIRLASAQLREQLEGEGVQVPISATFAELERLSEGKQVA